MCTYLFETYRGQRLNYFSTVIILILAPTDSVSLGKSFYFSGSISLSVNELVKHFKNIQRCREPSVSTVLFGSSYRLGED